jgi:hypothetical protein
MTIQAIGSHCPFSREDVQSGPPGKSCLVDALMVDPNLLQVFTLRVGHLILLTAEVAAKLTQDETRTVLRFSPSEVQTRLAVLTDYAEAAELLKAQET